MSERTQRKLAAEERMYVALQRIAAYQSVSRLRRSSNKDWGMDFEEALEMAYENVLQEAKNGLKGIRKPRILADPLPPPQDPTP